MVMKKQLIEQQMSTFVRSRMERGMDPAKIRSAFKDKFGRDIPGWLDYLLDFSNYCELRSARSSDTDYRKTTKLLKSGVYEEKLRELKTPREVQLYALQVGEDPRTLITLWVVYRKQQALQEEERAKQERIEAVVRDKSLSITKKILSLRKMELTGYEISAALSIPDQTVWRILRENGMSGRIK